MGLSSFSRRILGIGRFPRLEGQELPDPVTVGPKSAGGDPADRIKTLGRIVKPPKVKIDPKPQ
jgi:hypothetical protein